MIELPINLTLIRDQVIDHVRKNTSLPDKLNELTHWYESDGWDVLVPVWAEEEHVALALRASRQGKVNGPCRPPQRVEDKGTSSTPLDEGNLVARVGVTQGSVTKDAKPQSKAHLTTLHLLHKIQRERTDAKQGGIVSRVEIVPRIPGPRAYPALPSPYTSFSGLRYYGLCRACRRVGDDTPHCDTPHVCRHARSAINS